MRKIFFFLLLLVVPAVAFQGCLKDYEPMIEGRWDRVRVRDVNHEEQWHFLDNDIIIKRHPIDDSTAVRVAIRGRYMVRNRFGGLQVRFSEMRDFRDQPIHRYNNDWEVMKLNKKQMILSVEIPGEVIYKEFTKGAEE